MPIIILLGFVGAIFIYFAFDAFKKFRMMEDTPLSYLKSAAQGHIEVKGVALAFDQPQFLNYSGNQCVYKRIVIQEEKVKVNTKGQRSTEWKTISDTYEGNLFYLKDNTGIAEVITQKFEIDGVVNEYPYSQDLGGLLGLLVGVNRRRVIETSLPTGVQIFMQGKFLTSQKTSQLTTQKILGTLSFNENLPSFITIKSEQDMISKSKLKFYLFLIAGGIFITAAVLLKLKSH
jgi:hypothetical protein